MDDEPARLYLDYGDDRAYHACPGLLTESVLHTLKIVRDGKDYVFEVETDSHPMDWDISTQPQRFQDLLRDGRNGSMYIEQIEFLAFDLEISGTQAAPSASVTTVDGTWQASSIEVNAGSTSR